MIKKMRDKTGRMRSVNYDYINSYAAIHYDRITIIVPTGTKEKIKRQAETEGKSTSEYIVSFLPPELVNQWKTKE